MIRHGIGMVCAVLAAAQLVESAAARQPLTAVDKIVLRNSAKKDGTTTTLEGKLSLSPAGLAVLSGEKLDKATKITFADIVKYEPGDFPGANRDEMLATLKLENGRTRKDYQEARVGYAAMLKKAAGAPEPTRRHLEFRVAMMSTKIADETPDDEKWNEFADTAAKEWGSFLTGYKTGWEIWPAARANARLLAELSRYDEVAKLWGRFAKNPELPPDLRLEAGLQEIDAHIRAKNFSTAATLAEALGKTTGPGPAKDKLAIYERAAKAAEGGLKADAIKAVVDDLEKKLAASKDPAVRGVGFGMIGELYLLANKPRDAMWSFLWVETVYNADKDEVLKSMCRLTDIFKSLTDADRQKLYREKIRQFREGF